MKPTTSQSVRANAVRIELNSRPAIDADAYPQRWHTMTLDRSPDEFSVHEFQVDDLVSDNDRLQEFESVASTTYRDPAGAWSWMLSGKNDDYFGVVVFIGPGDSPVTLETPIMQPNQFSVWMIDRESRPHVIGQYHHRLSAMTVAKAIVDAGLCPIVATPFMCIDSEWDSEHVLQSSEVSEALLRALR